MPNTTVNLVKGTMPPNACFSSVEALYDLFIDSTTAHVKGQYSLFNYGDSVPAASDRDKPWIRTINQAPDRVYVYKSGYWLSKHPCPALSKERRIWTGTASELITYDGGSDVATPNDYQGPMWEVDDALNAPEYANKSYEAEIFDTVNLSGVAALNPTIVTEKHGLGELPDNVTVSLLCNIDDTVTGYVAGDEVPIYSTWVNESSSHRDTPTTSVSFDDEEVRITLAPHAAGIESRFDMFHKTTAVKGVSPSMTKWKYRIRVWKKGGKILSGASTNFSYIKRTSRVFYTA